MLPILATDDEDVYVTGDTHFGHGNIIKFCHRPFLDDADRAALTANGGVWHDGSWKGPKQNKHKISADSIRMMDDALIANINATVPRDGHLIHVGDFAMMPKEDAPASVWADYCQNCREKRARINCRQMTLLWGNHDSPSMLNEVFGYGKDTTDYVGKVVLKKEGIILVLSHYAHLVWDESHRGAIHGYGHSHSEIEKYADELMPGRRALDVGVDNAFRLMGSYRPFTLDEILHFVGGREGYALNPNTPKFTREPREGH